MSPKLVHLTNELQSAGVSPAVLRMVQQDLSKRDVPSIKGPVAQRMREVVAEHGKAVLVLCTNGSYKVFSPEGHDVLRDSARKHKPWALPRHADKH